MSKITNLIGTTWRLGEKSFTGLTSADFRGVYIDGIGTVYLYDGDNIVDVVENLQLEAIVSYVDDVAIGIFTQPNNNTLSVPFGYGEVEDGVFGTVVYEFTITGGADISNPLFIDFINTYGTLVSGGEPPTAEGVKSKLQSLITASNAKTGKSDANLTDAVKTLLEGFGSGEGIFAEEENEHGTTIVLGADLQEKTIDITANGTVEVTPDEGYALKKVTANVNVGGEEWINDGNTHIWVTLPEGRTSPILFIGVNGTVTVDWGDGTTPDVLTGTSVTTQRWTPAHNYASAGDYIITLTADGEIGFIKYGTTNSGLLIASSRNSVTYLYKGVIKKIECGNNVTNFADSALCDCRSLRAVKLPNGLTKIGFNVLSGDYSLSAITIPEGVQSIGNQAIYECYSLTNITIPSSVTSIDTRGIANCENLSNVTLQNGLTSIGAYALAANYSLNSITIPATVTSIGDRAFDSCYGLAKVRFEPTTPPTLGGSSVFSNVPYDCIISVPVGSLEAYTTATNYPSASSYTYVEE